MFELGLISGLILGAVIGIALTSLVFKNTDTDYDDDCDNLKYEIDEEWM